MTTIAAYNVSLSLDANRYIDSSKLSRKETASLQRIINTTRSPAERYERSLNTLSSAYKKGAIDIKTYNNLLAKQEGKLERAAAANKKFRSGLSKVAAGVAAIGVGSFIKDSIKLSMQAEQAAASFEVLTGSANNAEFVIASLRDMAAKSPITFVGAQDAAKTLLGFGVATSQVIPSLRMLEAVSMGNEERFKNLALAFAQVQSAGKLTGQDLLQMINAGFNPLQIISEQTGQSIGELRDAMSAGAISAQQVTDAFAAATSEGGKFDGMAEKLAETTSGKLAQAMSQLQQTQAKVGETFNTLILTMTDGAEQGSSALDGLVFLFQKFNDGVAGGIALVQDLGRQVQALITMDFDKFFEFKNFNALLDKLDKRDAAAAAAADKPPIELDDKSAQDAKASIEAGLDASVQGSQLNEAVSSFAATAAKFAERMGIINLGDQTNDAIKQSINSVLTEGLDSDKTTSFWQEVSAWSEKVAQQEKDRLQAAKDAQMQLGQQALANAQQHFENEKKLAEKRQQDIVNLMSNASMEVGGGADVAFLAKQQNKLMAGNKAGQQPTEKQLLSETKRQYQLLLQQKMKDEQRNKLLEKMIATISETKIEPIR